jgi:hypothetical protein
LDGRKLPRDRLQIQVLDDSTDETQDICPRAVAALKSHHPDLDIEYVPHGSHRVQGGA